MARGSVIRRCRACRKEGKSGYKRCNHKEITYVISYRVGRKQKWETIGPNKKEAEKVLAQRVSEVNNGTFYQTQEIIFNDFIDKWLDEYAAPRIKVNTLYKYKNTQLYLGCPFGAKSNKAINGHESGMTSGLNGW